MYCMEDSTDFVGLLLWVGLSSHVAEEMEVGLGAIQILRNQDFDTFVPHPPTL